MINTEKLQNMADEYTNKCDNILQLSLTLSKKKLL